MSEGGDELEPAFQTMLLERLGASGNDAPPNANDLAAAVAAQFDDPVMSTLASLMLARRGDSRESPEVDVEQQLAKARRTIRRLRDLLEPASELAAYVAETFGACGSCWGLNVECGHCAGNGRAGWLHPAREELLAWAEPALARLGMQVVAIPEDGRGPDVPSATREE